MEEGVTFWGVDDQQSDWYNYIVEGPCGAIYAGATNGIRRRMRQHNNRLSGGSLRCKAWGQDQAKLVVLIGPLSSRTAALAIERRLKNKIVKNGGVAGRLCAIVWLLQLPGGFVSKSAKLTSTQLKQLEIRTSHTISQVMSIVGLSEHELRETAQWVFAATL